MVVTLLQQTHTGVLGVCWETHNTLKRAYPLRYRLHMTHTHTQAHLWMKDCKASELQDASGETPCKLPPKQTPQPTK